MTSQTAPAPSLLDLPPRPVLTVDGRGAPEDAPFTAAVRALFAVRAALGARDDVPLEGAYSQHDDPAAFDLHDPAGWQWRLLVPAPDHAGADAVLTAASRFGAPVVLRVQSSRLVAQLLHHGPYADEEPSLRALYAFVSAQRLLPIGPHTEVYLTDPRRTAPAELRTLLQVPVRR
ncbi:GyrI-like domain-containing protein [Pseudonocardia saturnea]